MYVPLRKNKLIYNLLMFKPEKFNFFYEIVFDLGFELILWCSKNLDFRANAAFQCVYALG